MLKQAKYTYYNNCVNWPRRDVENLSDMIDNAIDISRRTFLKHIDRGDLTVFESTLCYAGHPKQGLTMAGDYHVSYHRSKLHGKRVYYFRHSAMFLNSIRQINCDNPRIQKARFFEIRQVDAPGAQHLAVDFGAAVLESDHS